MALLAAVAVVSYLVGIQQAVAAVDAQPVVAPAVVETPAAAPTPTTAASAPPAAVTGPTVTDNRGRALPSAVATVVQRIYTALDSGDLEPIRRAYSAVGSDDWYTSSPQLKKTSVQTALLKALSTAPKSQEGEYRYSAGGYQITVGTSPWSDDAGLFSITGPWSTSSSQSGSSNAGTTATQGGECGPGTVNRPADGLPCTDIATGTGVLQDGTAGVHGLRPCPPGTVIPDDESQPTRNAKTGEVCGIVV